MTKLYVTADELKKAADYLAAHKEEGGCYHWKIYANTEDKTDISIVLGWTGCPNEPTKDQDKYYDDGYRLAVKVGYQPSNSIMQSDYDFDFRLPCYPTGDLMIECEEIIRESTDFEWLAKNICTEASRVIKNWKELKHD